MGDADHAVLILVKHRHTGEARLAHEVHDLGDRLDILGHGHVDARHHDLARGGVTQVEHLMDDALLLVEQGVLLVDHVADLLLGDILTVVGVLDAQDAGEAVGGSLRQPDERASDLLEHRERFGDALGHALGIGQGDALGNKLAHDDREVRHGERDEYGREAGGDHGQRIDTEARQPLRERVGQARRGDRRRRKAHERDRDLDGGEEAAGIGRELGGAGGAAVAFFRLVVEHGALGRGEGHLRHGEVAVDNGKDKCGDDTDGDVHGDGLKPPG